MSSKAQGGKTQTNKQTNSDEGGTHLILQKTCRRCRQDRRSAEAGVGACALLLPARPDPRKLGPAGVSGLDSGRGWSTASPISAPTFLPPEWGGAEGERSPQVIQGTTTPSGRSLPWAPVRVTSGLCIWDMPPPHPSVSSTLGKLNPGTGFDLLLRWSKLERLLVGPGASERGPEP